MLLPENDGQAAEQAKVNPAGGSGRDSWCTPKWLAALLGVVDLDPCSNEDSHIRACVSLLLSAGSDGLYGSPSEFRCDGEDMFWAPGNWTVFVNPPYSRGAVINWIRHWINTRFIFLLRWDPSTAWFKELIAECTHVWFPNQRINFEPPEGVASSSNPFPHALYMRDPSPELLARLEPHGYLFRVDKMETAPQTVPHAPKHLTAGSEGRITHGSPGGGEKGAGVSSGIGRAGALTSEEWVRRFAQVLQDEALYEADTSLGTSHCQVLDARLRASPGLVAEGTAYVC